MTIPLRNIYYLLAYAWGAIEESKLVSVESDDFRTVPELLAGVLESGVTHLLKQGLDRSYIAEELETAVPRGKIDVTHTLKRSLLVKGQVHCTVDTLSQDVLQNQIIRSTLDTLVRMPELRKKQRRRLAVLSREMFDVSSITIRRNDFRKVAIHRNNRVYGFLINTCQLIFDSLQPHEAAGTLRFRDFIRDERKMAILFEKFVRNFFSREQEEFAVSNPTFQWKHLTATQEDLAYMPRMETDIVLTSHDRKIVIDTKYYKSALSPSKRFGRQKVRSEHLYQLYSYLGNVPVTSGVQLEGILLYPTVNKALNLEYLIDGKRIRICTVDLSNDWRSIHTRLLGLTEVIST